MADELVPAGAAALVAAVETAVEFAKAAKAANTLRAYESDWRHFSIWCASCNCRPLPAHPGQVAAYLGALASGGLKAKTIERRASAIGFYHLRAGHENPAAHPGVAETLAGIRNTLGTRPKKKAALTAELVGKAVKKISDTLGGKRDRALLLLGFAAALRRSELIGLDLTDIERHPRGRLVRLRRSKTDQAGAGTIKAVPHGHRLKAVAALDDWIETAGIHEGPLFRGVRGNRVLPGRLCDRQVARIVKKYVGRLGLDADLFAGHSLRSGFLTSASDANANVDKMRRHAGHAKVDTTLGYVESADAFRDHPGKTFL
jgi:site-specific recombinase XerD